MAIGSEGVISRELPQGTPNQQIGPPRFSKFREPVIQSYINNFNGLADEGSYYVATSSTPGTGTAYVVSSAFADTTAFLSIMNKDSYGGKRIYLDYIRLICTVAPASATASQFTIKTDSGASRLGITGSTTPLSVNVDTGSNSIADVKVNPSVAGVSIAVRQICRGVLRSVIPVVNDEWILTFGSNEKSSSISLATATAQRMTIPCSPLVLGPGNNQAMFLHIWHPGNATTAASYEYEVGYYER